MFWVLDVFNFRCFVFKTFWVLDVLGFRRFCFGHILDVLGLDVMVLDVLGEHGLVRLHTLHRFIAANAFHF
jgi:hypothetical protein